VASLLDLRQSITFEGQAAMEMEFALPETAADESPLPYRLTTAELPAGHEIIDRASATRNGLIVIDWEPLVLAILNGVKTGKSIGSLSAAFHNSLVEIIISIARRISQERVAEWRLLPEQVFERTDDERLLEGFRPYWHQRFLPMMVGLPLGKLPQQGLGKSNH
jgi:hydrogenase maturation protein HypF